MTSVLKGTDKTDGEDAASCWLCWEDIEQENMAPELGCACKGDLTKAHKSCMKEWLSKNPDACPNCRVTYKHKVVSAILSPRGSRKGARLALRAERMEHMASGPFPNTQAALRTESRRRLRDALHEQRRLHAEQRRSLLRGSGRAPGTSTAAAAGGVDAASSLREAARAAAWVPQSLAMPAGPTVALSEEHSRWLDAAFLNMLPGPQPIPQLGGPSYMTLGGAQYLVQPVTLPQNFPTFPFLQMPTAADSFAPTAAPSALIPSSNSLPDAPATRSSGRLRSSPAITDLDLEGPSAGPVRRGVSLRASRSSGPLGLRFVDPPTQSTSRRASLRSAQGHSLAADEGEGDTSSDSDSDDSDYQVECEEVVARPPVLRGTGGSRRGPQHGVAPTSLATATYTTAAAAAAGADGGRYLAIALDQPISTAFHAMPMPQLRAQPVAGDLASLAGVRFASSAPQPHQAAASSLLDEHAPAPHSRTSRPTLRTAAQRPRKRLRMNASPVETASPSVIDLTADD